MLQRVITGARLLLFPIALLAAGCLPAAPRHGLEDPVLDARFEFDGLTGPVRIDGSSTVFPISEAAAEEFGIVANGVRVMVGYSGTGGGFEKLCRGDTDLANASRPIRESELQNCAANGIEVLETEVAIDALSVVVNPENDWATCITVQELHEIFRAGGATRWSDVRAEWPDETIQVFHPGADSGTFDYFNEAVIEGIGEGAHHRTDGSPSEDDNILALGVQNNRFAIGYYGFAYYLQSSGNVRALAIDGGQGCVEPSPEAAVSGEYTPLSRPLYVYANTGALRENPQVAAFMKFYFDNLGFLVEDAGYIALSDEMRREQLERLMPFLPPERPAAVRAAATGSEQP